MTRPWDDASRSEEESSRQPALGRQVVFSAREMGRTRDLLARQAAAGLVRFAADTTMTGAQAAQRFRELMDGYWLRPVDFRTTGGQETSESRLFAAADEARTHLDLSAVRDGVRTGWDDEPDPDPEAYVAGVRAEHRRLFGKNLMVKDPAAFLESRLLAYARLLEAHQVMETSRLVPHATVDARWANDVGGLERRLSDAIAAQREPREAMQRSRITSSAAGTAVGAAATGALTGVLAAADQQPALAWTAGLSALTLSAFLVATLADRARIQTRTRAAQMAGRTNLADLNRTLRAGPAPGR